MVLCPPAIVQYSSPNEVSSRSCSSFSLVTSVAGNGTTGEIVSVSEVNSAG